MWLWFPTLFRVEGLSWSVASPAQTITVCQSKLWFPSGLCAQNIFPLVQRYGEESWWELGCQEIQSADREDLTCSGDGQCFWGTSAYLMLPPLRNIEQKSVTARKGNPYLFIMLSPAAHHITVTFSGFLCVDCLLSHPPHSSKVNEAKQERNKKVSQRNADLLTKPKECKSNAELKYCCSRISDTTLEQPHICTSFRKFYCAWSREVILCLKSKKLKL